MNSKTALELAGMTAALPDMTRRFCNSCTALKYDLILADFSSLKLGYKWLPVALSWQQVATSWLRVATNWLRVAILVSGLPR